MLQTGTIKRISQYSGLDFKEVLNLPYSYFLLLNRESWIESYQATQEGRKILRNLWRLQQEKADEKAIAQFTGRREM